MAASPLPHDWKPEVVAGYLTAERLGPYLSCTHGDLQAALLLYEWNTHAAAAVMQTVGLLEVAVRNALDREASVWATSRHGVHTWFDVIPLDTRGRRTLEESRNRATRQGRTPERHGKVIAELPLGFWRYLVANRYHTSLWVPALHRAFPNGHPDLRERRKLVEKSLQDVSRIRNRAAHHEPLLRLDLEHYLDHILDAARWISHDVELWVDDLTTLPDIRRRRPS